MPKILNLFFSSRKDHAAANYIHSEIGSHLLSRGYDVTGVCLSGNASEWLSHMPEPTFFWEFDRDAVKGKKLFANFILQRRLNHFLNEGKYDVIICDGLGILNLLSKLKNQNLPAVITVQHAPPRKADVPNSRVRQLFTQNKLSIVAISEMVKERLFLAGFGNANQVPVIHNAVNFSLLRHRLINRDDARLILKLSDDNFIIGVIGRLVSCKQQKLLLEALVALKGRNQLAANWRVLMIGDGPELTKLREYAHVHHIDEHVVFAGALDNASRYVKAMDLFVMTSSEDEGFGLVILEAMAGHVPVIANDTPVFRELVRDVKCRFHLNSAQSLSEKVLEFYQMSHAKRDDIAYRQSECAENLYNIERFNLAYESLVQKKIAP